MVYKSLFIWIGVGIEDPVQEKLNIPLASAVLYLAATQVEQGIIDFNDNSIQRAIFGLNSGPHYTNRLTEYNHDLARFTRLVETLQQQSPSSAQIEHIVPSEPTRPNTHFQALRYHKLLWNASFGSVCPLTGKDCLQVLSDPHCYNLLSSLMQEVYDTACALLNTHDQSFPPKGSYTIQEYLERSKKIGSYRPSIQWDFDAKRPMECEILLGNVVECAKRVGVEVPRLDTMLTLMRMYQKSFLES
jgi:2-dehydropantoate 2-reductase